MGTQIIKQDDGKYSIWSTIMDDFTVIDCTADEIVAYFVDRSAARVREEICKILAQLDAGEKPYYQFTMTYAQCIKEIKDKPHRDKFNRDRASK